MNDQDKQKWQQLIGLGVVTVIGLGLLAQSRYREISWKEFVETHLSRGTVERLEVINSKWVKVILKAGGMDSEVIWFSIGSPDRFERNLEAAQNELGIEAARSVPVLYKTRMEMSDLFSFIPPLSPDDPPGPPEQAWSPLPPSPPPRPRWASQLRQPAAGACARAP